MKKIILIFVISLFLFAESLAQYGSIGASSARSMAMGKSYVSSSRGINSLGINPANLSYNPDGAVDFSLVLPLPLFSVRTGSDVLTIDDMNYFFGGVDGKSRLLTTEDKSRLSEMFSDGGTMFFNAAVNIMAVSYKHDESIGAFAFAINDQLGSSISLPQGLIDIALNGNPIGKEYKFDDTDLKSWWIRNYSLSYSRELSELKLDMFDRVAAGISLKMVHGFAYAGINEFNTVLRTTGDNEISGTASYSGNSSFSEDFAVRYKGDPDLGLDGSAGPFPSPAGSGFGFDLGFAVTMDKLWNFSLAITDIGSISWDNNAREFSDNSNFFFDDITDKKQRDSLENILLAFNGESKKVGSFSTSLPTALRLGASYLFEEEASGIPGTLLVEANYNQGFNDMPGNSMTPRFSIGTEWKPMDWVPFIRTGFSFGGYDGFGWGFGLGVDIANLVELNFATSDMQSFLAPNASKHISFALGSRWKIGY